MANAQAWDQSVFDSTLREYLAAHESKVWPKLINKKMFFISLGAFKNIPPVIPFRIQLEMDREILAKRKDGTTGMVKIGDAMAAKRASKHFEGSRRFQRAASKDLAKEMGGRGQGGDYQAAWLANLKEERRSMVGGRKASVGFLRAGFVSIVYALGPIVGQARPGRGADTKMRGSVKGSVVHLATAHNLSITIENRAHSKTEKLGGFERIGGAALQRAFDKEAASMEKYLSDEMEPHAKEFNQKQH